MAQETPGLSALANLFAGWPFRVEGQWYYNQVVSVDGYRFVRCHFDSCQIETTKATFVFEQCKFTSCSIVYRGEAWRAARLYILFAPAAYQEAMTRWPSLLPIWNQDQTFTIP